jgi:hypothetical protein
VTFDGPGTRMVQLIDLQDTRSNRDGKLTRNEKEVPRGEMCYFASPYDMPMYLRFWRRITKRGNDPTAAVFDHLGTTMEVDCYTFGVKFYVRYDRPTVKGQGGKLILIAEDSEGREVLAEYDMTGS